jgi:hypothetical protein
MSSTVVGYIQGYGKEQCWNWAMSLKRHYRGDVVVMASQITQETYDWLTGLGFTVYTHTPQNTLPVVTRFLVLWQLIQQNKIADGWVMLSDVKDVVFQADLDLLFRRARFNKWVGGGENVRYKDEPWGRENLSYSFPHAYQQLETMQIINAGTFAARTDLMAEICMLVYYMSLGSQVRNPDQAALNVLLRTGPFSDCGWVYGIDDDYAIQIGTTMDPNKKLPQIIEFEENTAVLTMSALCNKEGEPYHIVHQYDRNSLLKEMFDSMYKDGA